MNKTIDERAEEIYRGNTIEQDAYIRGATDQAEITKQEMILEAYNALHKILPKEELDGVIETLKKYKAY